MPIFGLKPESIDRFSGLVTLADPVSLLPYLSPDCQDVQFAPGKVWTRPGLVNAYFNYASGNITWLKSYITPSLVELLLSFHTGGTGTGVLLKTTPPSAFVQVRDFGVNANHVVVMRSNSVTAFGREYIALSDGKAGLLPPFHYDGTNLDRVAPDGPYFDGAIAENATAGNVSAGVHKMRVLYEYRSGYRTRPSVGTLAGAGAELNATGSLTVDISNIPVGPAGVVRRIICLTAAGGSHFYFIPNSWMVINDNTTTSLTAKDFIDSELLSGVNVDSLFRNVVLPPCAGVIQYSSRLLWWGEQRTLGYGTEQLAPPIVSPTQVPIPQLADLEFDGTSNTLSGWTNITNTDIENSIVLSGSSAKLNGTGAATPAGFMTRANPLVFQAGRSYSVRAWVRKTASLAAGTLRIFLSTSSTFATAIANITTSPGLSVAHSAMTQDFQLFSAVLRSPTDVTGAFLWVQLTDTPTSGQSVYVEGVSVYPTEEPTLGNIVRVSNPEEPDRYDGVDGFLGLPNDGQAIRSCFVLRDFLYIVKEHSLYVTFDDGVNPPALWNINRVSSRVGTPSIRGVGVGDEWVIIAGHEGVFYFDGGEPVKISQEIQPTWDQINWVYEHLLEVKVDTKRKRVHIAIPFGASTECDRMLVLDYKEGFGDPAANRGIGRKWCPWIIPCDSMAIISPSAESHEFIVGSNDGTGRIRRLSDAALDDAGAAINSYWQSGYWSFPERLLVGYIRAGLSGAGVSSLRLFRGGQADSKILRGWPLSASPSHSLERQVQAVRDSLSVRIGTNYAGHWFELTELTPFIRRADHTPIRGHNQ